MISPASTNPTLTDQGRALVFRVVRSDADQARFAADHVLDRQLSAHIATVHDNSAYGQLLVAAFMERVRQRGGTIAAAYSIQPGAKDYPSLMASLRTDRVGLVYFGGYAPEAAAIARGAAQAGVSIQLVGADALVDRGFWREAGPAGEGTLMPFIADPRQAPAAQDVVASFKRDGVDPKGYVLFSYAAVQVWAQAAERSGGTAGARVADALRSATFSTVLGELAFDGRGDVVGGPPREMLRWSAGRYAPVGRWLPGMWTQEDDTPSRSGTERTASGAARRGTSASEA
jgi:branched-chain amino acid transport system substrate-binding protein